MTLITPRDTWRYCSGWLVLHIPGSDKDRERRASDKLRQHGVETYLPTVPNKRKRYRRRTARHTERLAMFPGYLFAKIQNAAQRSNLSDLGHVLRLAGSTDDFILGNNEIRALQTIEAIGIEPRPTDDGPKYDIGMVLEILEGPFSEMQGAVKNINKAKLRYVLDGFGNFRSVEIDQHNLRIVA